MSEFFPVIFGLVFVGILGSAAALFLKAFNPPWWRYRWVKLAIILAVLVGLISILCWGLGTAYGIRILLAFGATTTALTIILLIALILSLPISGIVHGVEWLIGKIPRESREVKTVPINQSRRIFIKTAVAAIPSITIMAGAGGFGESFARTKIPIINMIFPGLPPDLIGFRILQISDSHLGLYLGLSHMEKLLADAAPLNPDLILVTGDVADDLNLLPDTLKMISQVKTQYGVYACLGNHEYYRGITRVRKIFDESPIPLLVNDGLTIPVANTKLYLGAADDPRFLRKDNSEFFKATVDRAIQKKISGSFSVLLSHRPDAFDYAANSGINLTLSGHTHGGQIGFAGQSIFEPLISYKYLWGKYLHDNGAQLYTTCGVGHWFPFRLGCPSEAPVIILNS